MDKYIMALDQGTTSSRAVIFDRQCRVVSMAQRGLAQYYPREGWVEHDALQILGDQLGAAREAMQKIGAGHENISAVGIANQRETAIIWDRRTGLPLHNAVVWQCRRTAGLCGELAREGWGDKIKAKCGLVLDPYFSGAKIKWLLDNIPGARERAEGGELLFGTVDTWLLWNLTGLHITDYSNASRTMLYNIYKLEWDGEILERLAIPRAMLPEVRASSMIYGESKPEIFGGPVIISGMAGDQQAALFGQGCHEPGMAKNTYGTGCFMLMNTGGPVGSEHNLLTTVAWGLPGENNADRLEYALEGSVFTAGAAVQWLRDELRLLGSAAESEFWASQVADTGGVYVVPAFTGLGAPHWDAHARGTITGLTRGTGKAHIIRAALESIAYQTLDVLQAMQSDSGISLKSLKVDGGACANDFLMQFQADIIQAPVLRPACIESTALGAALLAGLASGYWPGKSVLSGEPARVFEPDADMRNRDELIDGWRAAVKRAL